MGSLTHTQPTLLASLNPAVRQEDGPMIPILMHRPKFLTKLLAVRFILYAALMTFQRLAG